MQPKQRQFSLWYSVVLLTRFVVGPTSPSIAAIHASLSTIEAADHG